MTSTTNNLTDLAAPSPMTARPERAHEIVVLGAKEHNLQNVSVRIPRD